MTCTPTPAPPLPLSLSSSLVSHPPNARARSPALRPSSPRSYFKGHAIYGRAHAPYAERLGVPTLARFLSRVLLGHLKQHMPQILREVVALYETTERNLADLGPSVPPDAASRSALSLASAFGALAATSGRYHRRWIRRSSLCPCFTTEDVR